MNQITANQTAITNIKDGTTIDSFGDVETALSGKEDISNKREVVILNENDYDNRYDKLFFDIIKEYAEKYKWIAYEG